MTEKFYNEFKDLDLSLEELRSKAHQLENELTYIYHDMSLAIFSSDAERFKLLNDKSIDIHCRLSAIRILINQMESDLG